MENVNEGRAVHRPKILYGIKNPPKIILNDNYEDCKYQVDYDFEENPRLAKTFSKVMRKLDKRFENNISTNVKNIQHK